VTAVRAPIPTEEQEQRALVAWLRYNGILFTHVPNGGYRTRAEAGIFRALGVSAGVPDVLIFDPPPCVPDRRGVAIELKRSRGGRVTPEQRNWLDALHARGWETMICHGADVAIEYLRRLGYGRKTSP